MENKEIVKRIPLSVVLCAYNAEKYIGQTIESVLSQTFKDFEFIVWNDGSTDNTKDVILKYNDPRIVYFEDSNKGEGEAARLACMKAQGIYIARIDADDICMPQRLELEYRFLESHQDYVLVSSAFSYIDSEGNYIGRAFPITCSRVLRKLIMKNNYFVHSGSMYRAEAYRKVGGYKNVRLFQDHLLFRNLSAIGKIAILEDVLIKYRVLGNSVAHVIENSPYKQILCDLENKILLEKGERLDDILLFNQLYGLARKNTMIDSSNVCIMKDLQNQFYNLIARVLGKKISAKIIVGFKNVVVSFRQV